MASWLRFFLSRQFWSTLLAILFLLVLISWLLGFSLNIYSHHGESIIVPDVKGLEIDKAIQQLKNKGLQYALLDSTFIKGEKPGEVLEQDPIPGKSVKENRRIYLTINAFRPPNVKIPKIVHASLRNATIQLESVGLEVGNIEYVPDLAKNAVLDLKVNGNSVKPETEIAKGSKIDLVLGNGIGNTRILVPDVVGLTFRQAKILLKGYSLNTGVVIPNANVIDRENAIVFKQNPPADSLGVSTVALGEPVDLFLKVNTNPNFNFNEEIQTKPNASQNRRDSLPVVYPLNRKR